MSFDVVSLSQLVNEYDESEVSRNLTFFSSINQDVELFLRNKAIQFEKIGLSRTSLVYTSYQGALVIAGYFAISSKQLTISKRNWKNLSGTVKRRLMPMGYKTEQDNYQISSILLGQLGVNFQYNVDGKHLISGEELLGIAYDEVRRANSAVGGNTLYLEADNIPQLRFFYTSNGFNQLMLTNDKKERVPYITPNNQHLYIKKMSDI